LESRGWRFDSLPAPTSLMPQFADVATTAAGPTTR
jgi:hypothetical protein